MGCDVMNPIQMKSMNKIEWVLCGVVCVRGALHVSRTKRYIFEHPAMSRRQSDPMWLNYMYESPTVNVMFATVNSWSRKARHVLSLLHFHWIEL